MEVLGASDVETTALDVDEEDGLAEVLDVEGDETEGDAFGWDDNC